ncbi:MAG: hypothetical protein ACHQ03_07620 [Candidatus Bathyarchaeia archaeon]
MFDEVITKAVEIRSRFTGSKSFDLKMLQDECEKHYNDIIGRVIEIRNKITEPKMQSMCQEAADQLQKRKSTLIPTFKKDSEKISNYIDICRTIK